MISSELRCLFEKTNSFLDFQISQHITTNRVCQATSFLCKLPFPIPQPGCSNHITHLASKVHHMRCKANITQFSNLMNPMISPKIHKFPIANCKKKTFEKNIRPNFGERAPNIRTITTRNIYRQGFLNVVFFRRTCTQRAFELVRKRNPSFNKNSLF